MEKNKDPAFMFYPSDFIVGTFMMTDEEVGKYIRLLCLQHQQGHLSEADFIALGGENSKIKTKFIQDEHGLYFNKRLDDEILKRVAFKDKQRANGSLGGKNKALAMLKQSGSDAKAMLQPSNSDAKAMLKPSCSTRVENENINENINISNKHKYGSYKNVLLTEEEYDKLKTEFPSDYNERIERLSEYIASSGKKYKSHLATIRSWARKEGDKPQKTRYGDFDVTEAFNAALNRTYG